MPPPVDPIEACFAEIEQARRRVLRIRGKQITRSDDRDYFKSVAYAWFRSHRPLLSGKLSEDGFEAVDRELKVVLEATARLSSKITYVTALRNAGKALMDLRSAALIPSKSTGPVSEAPPHFTPLASDPVMKGILERRWCECQRCIQANAPLAAIVMMGGLLEALFVARANMMPNKSALFRAKATPLDPRTKKPIQLSDWTLRPYIDVGAELSWITRSGKDVAAVLRDYRNYIHPEKERSHGITLADGDSAMLWEVTKSLARQLLASASSP